MPLATIVSGGQTGVDRAALDVAIAHALPHGGWCPRGRRAEDGRVPDRYRLREHASTDYSARTEQNVLDSDATLVLAVGAPRAGSALTVRLAARHDRPCLTVDLDRPPPPADVVAWLRRHGVRTLNVAGPRESTHPGIHDRAAAYLEEVVSSAMESFSQTDIDRAATLLGEARQLVVLTGAGISTESGIPDFRSPGGLWTRYDPTKLTFDRFCASAETRRLYWEMGNELYPALRDAQPNAAHRMLAALERRGGLRRIVTQNVDGLHQKAGSTAAVMIEIHGTALEVACLSCSARQDRGPVQARFAAGEHDLRCGCGGLLKPATISFGQAMPERETALAFADAAAADVFLVVGSSLVVYPAAGLPRAALENGARLVVVNREPTPYDTSADVALYASAGPVLSAIATHLGLALTDA